MGRTKYCRERRLRRLQEAEIAAAHEVALIEFQQWLKAEAELEARVEERMRQTATFSTLFDLIERTPNQGRRQLNRILCEP